jgi:hypothetical protein
VNRQIILDFDQFLGLMYNSVLEEGTHFIYHSVSTGGYYRCLLVNFHFVELKVVDVLHARVGAVEAFWTLERFR